MRRPAARDAVRRRADVPTIDALFEHLDSGGFACVDADAFMVATIAYRPATVRPKALPAPISGKCWN